MAQAGPGTSSLVLGSLLVESNASITHLSAAGNVNLTVLGNATVQSNASIFADGMGYTGANRGPGAGQTGPTATAAAPATAARAGPALRARQEEPLTVPASNPPIGAAREDCLTATIPISLKAAAPSSWVSQAL